MGHPPLRCPLAGSVPIDAAGPAGPRLLDEHVVGPGNGNWYETPANRLAASMPLSFVENRLKVEEPRVLASTPQEAPEPLQYETYNNEPAMARHALEAKQQARIAAADEANAKDEAHFREQQDAARRANPIACADAAKEYQNLRSAAMQASRLMKPPDANADAATLKKGNDTIERVRMCSPHLWKDK